jgi:hypothetical protein
LLPGVGVGSFSHLGEGLMLTGGLFP